MKNLTAFSFLLLFAGTVQQADCQTRVSKSRSNSGIENNSPAFIDDILFTPDGILQNTESGGRENIEPNDRVAGFVTKKMISESNLEPTSVEKMLPIQFKYAMILDVNVESLKNISLFGFIEKWLGTRYRMGGTTNKGIDCSALTSSLLMAVYGFSLPRTAFAQYNSSSHINKTDLKEGDLVFFNIRGGISHVGLYLENNYFVHASSSQGVTINNLDDPYYSKRFICGGRVEEDR